MIMHSYELIEAHANLVVWKPSKVGNICGKLHIGQEQKLNFL